MAFDSSAYPRMQFKKSQTTSSIELQFWVSSSSWKHNYWMDFLYRILLTLPAILQRIIYLTNGIFARLYIWPKYRTFIPFSCRKFDNYVGLLNETYKFYSKFNAWMIFSSIAFWIASFYFYVLFWDNFCLNYFYSNSYRIKAN